jgi:hypothetical protein
MMTMCPSEPVTKERLERLLSNRSGRPPISPDGEESRFVSFRISETEAILWKMEAAAREMSLSDFIRSSVRRRIAIDRGNA